MENTLKLTDKINLKILISISLDNDLLEVDVLSGGEKAFILPINKHETLRRSGFEYEIKDGYIIVKDVEVGDVEKVVSLINF